MTTFFFKVGVAYATANAGGNSSAVPAAPGDLIASYYQFALLAGVVLAFGVIVYGGVKYVLAVGNPSTQSDARDQVTQALLGLLLLLGAYIILNTINPNITSLSLPSLNRLQQALPPDSSIKVVCGDDTGMRIGNNCYNSVAECADSNCKKGAGGEHRHCRVADANECR